MRLLLAAALSLFALSAFAQPTPPPALPPPPPPGYIPSAHLDATLFLSPAPRPEGTVQAADMSVVRAAQIYKGSARWTQAQSDDDISPFTAFALVLGPTFTRAAAPRTGALFDRLFTDVTSLTAPPRSRSTARAHPRWIPRSRPASRSRSPRPIPPGTPPAAG